MDPGPVDVLKVAHHGSEDTGLGALLERSVPKLAVISVGAGNPYGHPLGQALAELGSHGVPRCAPTARARSRSTPGATGWTAHPGGG